MPPLESSALQESSHLWSIFWGSDPIVKLVLIILIGLSVGCWAIILYKYRELKRFKESSIRFFNIFWQTARLEDLVQKAARQDDPLANIFRRGFGPLVKKGAGRPGADRPGAGRPGADRPSPQALRQQVARATEDEVERIERYVPFLATTGSSAPYIGLFGTVWGILAAFWEIGKAGSTSLAVVGPYIAEALIATAAGLAAAIPAVIFYNFFVTRIRIFVRDVENFSEDLSQRIEREYLS